MKVASAKEMREIDRTTIEERAIPGIDLMERAGQVIARAMIDLIEPGPVLVLCGRGNNGGDGFVAARYLAESGFRVFLFPALGVENLSPDARLAYEKLSSDWVTFVSPKSADELGMLLEDMDGVIDALLGTGATPPLRDPLSWIVETVNSYRLPVVAADIPTGLDADTGQGDCLIRAATTVTIGLPKTGLLTPNGVSHAGYVRVEPIQFPLDLLTNPAIRRETVTLAEVAMMLPHRPLDGHKGTFGLVTICAGSQSMPGAATLAGTGALRSGVGLVRMHVPGSVAPAVAHHLPETLLGPNAASSYAGLGLLSESEWAMLMDRCTAAICGPGISTEAGSRAFVDHLLRNCDKPILLDADALTILAEESGWHTRLRTDTVLTPHPGEMARLLGTSVAEVQDDRWSAVARAAEKFQCVVVLKGYGTLIGDPAGEVIHVPAGNTALSRGGSGDVLSGMIGGLMAQGVSSRNAAVLGVFVCGLAADIVIREKSPRGVLIREVAETIPMAFRELEKATTRTYLG